MGNREAPVANMRFLLAVAVLTVVGTHAASDIVVKVDEEELSPLLRTFCCGSVQQRCARACTGRSCSLRCQGYCGVFNSRCGPYTCSSVTNARQQPTTAAATTAAATTAAATTAGDSTTAGGDSTTAGSDSTTVGGDSTTAGGDSTTAGGDSTTASSASTTDGTA